jgi:hypothetical protein
MLLPLYSFYPFISDTILNDVTCAILYATNYHYQRVFLSRKNKPFVIMMNYKINIAHQYVKCMTDFFY